MDKRSLSNAATADEAEEGAEGESVYEEGDENHELHKKGVSDVVHDFWETSTLQGLPRVFTSRAVFWKLFWLLMFILLMIGCIYQMWSIFTKFYARETTTSFEIGYGHIDFPSVTVCNINSFRESEVKKLLSPEMLAFYEMDIDEMDRELWSYTLDVLLSDYIRATISYEERRRIGHQLNTTILGAKFPEEKNTPAKFQTINSYFTGNCFTFNGPGTQNKSLKAEGAGQGKGLSMLLNAESHEYLKAQIPVRGFQMDVHRYNTQHDVGNIPITIPTGYMVHLNIRQTLIERLEAPYGECDQEYADSYKEIFGYDYTVEACNSTCFPFHILDTCGCYHEGYTKYYTKQQMENTRSCSTYEVGDSGVSPSMLSEKPTGNDTQCIEEVQERIKTDLKCSCPLPCRDVRYRVELSSAPLQQATWPVLRYAICEEYNSTDPESMCMMMKNTPHELEMEGIRRNFAYVKVYYLDLMFDHYEQNIAYERSQFISDFGGNLGLWLGASIFTVLELVELFTKIGAISMFRSNCQCSHAARRNLCTTRKKKRKNSKNNNDGALPLKDVSKA